jgi:mannose/cellobiose epimerase-like protein (N-acyl-D-glucosamine 2-epimerase family)
MEKGFDRDFGGLYYGIAPSDDVCSNGKYSWVQAETIAAAALLAVETQDNLYWCIYLQLWQYSIDNMVDADLNCWHRNLTFDNKIHDTSGISMGRTDYHSIAACFEIARSLIQSE